MKREIVARIWGSKTRDAEILADDILKIVAKYVSLDWEKYHKKENEWNELYVKGLLEGLYQFQRYHVQEDYTDEEERELLK